MAKKAKLSNRVVNFKCELDCGGQCCTGATMALPDNQINERLLLRAELALKF